MLDDCRANVEAISNRGEQFKVRNQILKEQEDILASQKDDLEELIEVARDSFTYSGLADYYSFKPKVVKEQLTNMILDYDKMLLVLDTDDGIQGFFGAVAFTGLFGEAVATYEQYIYVRDDYRTGGHLKTFMKIYNKWGEILGAKLQFMVSHEDHDKFDRFYTLFG